MDSEPIEIRLHQPNGDVRVLQFPAGSTFLRTVAIHEGPWYFVWDVMHLPDGRRITVREGTFEPPVHMLQQPICLN